jgi:Transglutaminase-like superfamily
MLFGAVGQFVLSSHRGGLTAWRQKAHIRCMQSGPYFLATHVYACIAGAQLIFLDLKRDQYFSLDRRSSAPVARLLQQAAALSSPPQVHHAMSEGADDAQPNHRPDEQPLPRGVPRALRMLLAQGLITTDPARGKRFSAPSLPLPEDSVLSQRTRRLTSIPPRDAARFVRATTRAAIKLRRETIEQTIESVRGRKANSESHIDTARVRELMATYHTLRPLLPKRYACLFDSLAVLEFLAFYGAYPAWVFGVYACPFSAHCWVQEGSLLLTDRADSVNRFTPIMSV